MLRRGVLENMSPLLTSLTLSCVIVLQHQITIICAISQLTATQNAHKFAPMRDSLDGIRDFLNFMSNFLKKYNIEDLFESLNYTQDNGTVNYFEDAKQFYDSKKILTENAYTLIQIGNFLRTRSTILDDKEDLESVVDSVSQRKKEIINIKDWKPFYVHNGNNGAINNDPSFIKHLEYLKTQIEVWNPFYINFPDEPSQDEILINFRLSQSVLTDLEDAIHIFEDTRKRVPQNSVEKLEVNDSIQNVSWKLLNRHITEDSLYNPRDPVLQQVIKDMKFMPFMTNYEPKGGTGQKLVFYMKNDMRVVFKPMRFPREQEVFPDLMFYKDYERHNAEIAGFHLDMYLPSTKEAKRTSWWHPWKRSYDKHEPKAEWQRDYNYCEKVKKMDGYRSGRRLLDIMDMAVFDFLQGNMDRHSFETFENFGVKSAPILYDNGSGFGKSEHDEISILGPIYQCCMIRYSTLKKLLAFYVGKNKLLAFYVGKNKLSDKMRESLSEDELDPIILEPHLHALDRRLDMVLRTVHKCVITNGFSNVVMDDGF